MAKNNRKGDDMNRMEIENQLLKEMLLKMTAAGGNPAALLPVSTPAAPVAHAALVKKRRAAVVALPTDAEPKVDWTKVMHTCPVCEKTMPVMPDFGLRIVRGITYKQSNCRVCRPKSGAHGPGFKRKRAYKPRQPR